MDANWGVIEDRDEDGSFIAYHVMPIVTVDGESIPSAFHDLSESCPCHPELQHGKGGWTIWCHRDPDHVGSREREAAKQATKALLN